MRGLKGKTKVGKQGYVLLRTKKKKLIWLIPAFSWIEVLPLIKIFLKWHFRHLNLDCNAVAEEGVGKRPTNIPVKTHSRGVGRGCRLHASAASLPPACVHTGWQPTGPCPHPAR